MNRHKKQNNYKTKETRYSSNILSNPASSLNNNSISIFFRATTSNTIWRRNIETLARTSKYSQIKLIPGLGRAARFAITFFAVSPLRNPFLDTPSQ
jgi:hypothetical protein